MRRMTALALIAYAACADPAGLASRSAAIVGGAAEPSWAGVGALTYQGAPFCTGVLIHSQWVLTAASCVDASTGIPASGTRFFVGNVVGGDGQSYDVARFVPHPAYASAASGIVNDIGLVELASPVPSSVATPVRVNGGGLAFWPGTSVQFVGFGSNVGYAGGGEGTKRSALLDLLSVDSMTLFTESTSTTGLCAGDSGAPGMLSVAGAWYVIGVTSTLSSSGTDPCLNGFSTQTRVDKYFSSFLLQHVPLDTCANPVQPDGTTCAGGTCQAGVCVVPAPDAGELADAAAPPDADEAPDGSELSFDASEPRDSGETTDASERSDAAEQVDAAASSDAGSPVADAAAPVDPGSPPDAASADAANGAKDAAAAHVADASGSDAGDSTPAAGCGCGTAGRPAVSQSALLVLIGMLISGRRR